MNFLRPSMLHASSASRRSTIFSAAVKNLNDSSGCDAACAWKYWRRSNHCNLLLGNNQLRAHHMYTASAQKYYDERANKNCNGCVLSHLRFSTMPHSTSSKDEKQKTAKDGELDSMPASQKARVLFKKYGAVFVGTYFGVYFSTLFVFFVTLDSGLLDPDVLSQLFKVSKDMACETADIIGPTGTGASVNEAADAYRVEMNTEISKDKRTLVDIITGYLLSWEWTSKYAEKLSENPHLTNLAVAWFAVKFTEPVRLAASILLTPKVSKALGQKAAKVESK